MQLTKKIKLESFILFSLSIFQKIMEFLTIIVLSRLLLPKEFGLFGLAFAINGLIAVIGSLGISHYIVYEKDISDSLLSFAFWLNLFISVILLLIAVLLAPALAVFFEVPELKLVLYILSLSIIFTAFGTIHLAILQKNLEFKKIGYIQASVTIFGSVLSIYLAIKGHGVYSFVIPIVLNSGLFSVLYWIAEKWRPKFELNFRFAKPMLNYGKHIFLGDANSYIVQNVGYLIIGKFQSIQTLGYFKFSFSLAMALVFLFNDLANKLIMPLYSYFKQSSEQIKEVMVRIFQYLTVFSVPAFTGLVIIAPRLILTLFGEKWVPAIAAFQILCLMGMFVVISRPIPAVLNALGQPRIRSIYTSVFLPVLTISLLIIVTYGFEIFVVAYTLGNIVFVFIMFVKTMHIIDLKALAVLRQMNFIILPVAVMSLAIVGVDRIVLLLSGKAMIQLSLQILGGAIIFLLAFKIFHGNIFSLLYKPIAGLRNRDAA